MPWFPLNLVKDRLVAWLLQSEMDYLLILDFHPLLTPSNAVWKLTFSNSASTPLPCCPPSDCQRLWFSIITELAHVINACIIILIIIICTASVWNPASINVAWHHQQVILACWYCLYSLICKPTISWRHFYSLYVPCIKLPPFYS